MDTLSGETTVKFLLPLSEKGSTLKGNRLFAPVFPFRVYPFSIGTCCAGKQTGSHKR